MKIIARIRSDFPTKFGIPRQSGRVEELTARVVFEPESGVREAVKGLEDFSHIWLLWEFSQAIRENWSPTVRPPRLGGNERMGVFAKISIVEVLLKLFLTIVITNIAFDKLKMYSVLMMFNAAVIFTIYFVYCRTHFDYTKYIFCFDKSLFKRILSFTGWNMLGSLSGTLSESGVSLIFNVFCGVILNASIGLSNQINGALSGFIAGFQATNRKNVCSQAKARFSPVGMPVVKVFVLPVLLGFCSGNMQYGLYLACLVGGSAAVCVYL